MSGLRHLVVGEGPRSAAGATLPATVAPRVEGEHAVLFALDARDGAVFRAGNHDGALASAFAWANARWPHARVYRLDAREIWSANVAAEVRSSRRNATYRRGDPRAAAITSALLRAGREITPSPDADDGVDFTPLARAGASYYTEPED